jgi:predicted HTH domain antitoxin
MGFMTVNFTIELPEALGQRLHDRFASLGEEAREAVLIDLYRRELITEAELCGLLGVSRLEIDGVLKRHGVMIEMTADEFAAETAELRHQITR